MNILTHWRSSYSGADEIVSRDKITKMRDVGGKIRFQYAGIFLILDWESQHLEVLVIQDRRKINLKQKRRDSWKRRWRLVGERGEGWSKIKRFSIINSLCFMSPRPLDNPSMRNFVITYRIRRQEKNTHLAFGSIYLMLAKVTGTMNEQYLFWYLYIVFLHY